MTAILFPPILFVMVYIEVLFRAYHLIGILRKENIYKLVACTGSIYDLPAASIACSYIKIPYVSYLFDDYLYQWRVSFRWIAKFFEKKVFCKSSDIIVPNEFMVKEVEKRYALPSILIRNGANIETFNPQYEVRRPFRFVFLGSVYYTNYSAIDGFIKMLDITGTVYSFTMYTSQPINDNSYKYYLSGSNLLVNNSVPSNNINKCYSENDIVLLPLSLDPKHFQIIRTSAPGKFGEYLNCGRIILAVVPQNCFIDWYLRKYKCGFVVNDLTNLSSILNDIITDHKQTKLYINNAINRSKLDFDLHIAQEKFYRIIWS